MQLSPYRVAELREHARDVLELTRRDIAAGPCSVCDSDVGYTCERCRLELAACDLARALSASQANAAKLSVFRWPPRRLPRTGRS